MLTISLLLALSAGMLLAALLRRLSQQAAEHSALLSTILALAATGAALAATVIYFSVLAPESAGPLMMGWSLGLGTGIGHGSRPDRWTEQRALARGALWLLAWSWFYCIARVTGSLGPSLPASMALLAGMTCAGRATGINVGLRLRTRGGARGGKKTPH